MTRATATRVLGWLLAAGAVGCGPSSGGGDAGPGGGGGDAGRDEDDDQDDRIDASCGAQSEEIGLVSLGDPPDLLIVLDRSGSMSSPVPSFPPTFTSMWTTMRNALEDLTMAKEDNIRFGLLEFPSDDGCMADGAPEVEVDLGQHAEVASYFSSRQPDGNTPAHLALEGALGYYASIPVNPEGRYVLFATDGVPNCGGDGDAAADVKAIAAVTALANAGIPTFVLGFGSFLGGDADVLNDAAVAGGVPKPGGPPHFYNAANAAELNAVLDEIAGGLIVPSCSFALDAPPPDPELVTVTLDGVVVPRSPSHQDGWDYHPDASTITFFGSYCGQIEGSAMTAVSFSYGCPGPVVE